MVLKVRQRHFLCSCWLIQVEAQPHRPQHLEQRLLIRRPVLADREDVSPDGQAFWLALLPLLLCIVEGDHERQVSFLRYHPHVRLEVCGQRLEALPQRVVCRNLARPRPRLLPVAVEVAVVVPPVQPVRSLHGVQAAPDRRLQHLVDVDVTVPVAESGLGKDMDLLHVHAHLLDSRLVLLLDPMGRDALGDGEVELEEGEEAAREVLQDVKDALLVLQIAGGEDAEEADRGAEVLNDALHQRGPGSAELDKQAAAVGVQLLPKFLHVSLEVDPGEEAKVRSLALGHADDPSLAREGVVKVPRRDHLHQLRDCHQAARMDLRARILALAERGDEL
mmetsp:Transcript_19082/g.62851  ORF Transcript_19082/g.62851 Transcript_19082/m.62851 type:complete len:334 (-) Transcript_19082:2886-3887(-)